MSKRLVRNGRALAYLARERHKQRRLAVLNKAPPDLIHCLVECVVNLLKGRVPLTPKQKKALLKHRQALQLVSKQRYTNNARKVLKQKGGFLPAVLVPILAAAAGGVLSDVIGKLINK